MKKKTKRLRIGSLVHLKSGSPTMTVDQTKDGQAKVVWFNRNPSGDWNPNLQVAVIPIEALAVTKLLKLRGSKVTAVIGAKAKR